jgi:hypothetical protein
MKTPISLLYTHICMTAADDSSIPALKIFPARWQHLLGRPCCPSAEIRPLMIIDVDFSLLFFARHSK